MILLPCDSSDALETLVEEVSLSVAAERGETSGTLMLVDTQLLAGGETDREVNCDAADGTGEMEMRASE